MPVYSMIKDVSDCLISRSSVGSRHFYLAGKFLSTSCNSAMTRLKMSIHAERLPKHVMMHLCGDALRRAVTNKKDVKEERLAKSSKDVNYIFHASQFRSK